MKIGYAGHSSYRAVIEHTKDVTLGVTEEVRAVMVEHASMEGPDDLPTINTSMPVRVLLSSDELRDQFYELYNIKAGYPATYLYCFVSESGVSDIMEMSYSTRFLTGDIGPQIGFVQGTGIACEDDVFLAVPGLKDLLDGVREMEYYGEVAIGLKEDFSMCDILFGHFTGAYALYNELSHSNMCNTLAWCAGRGEPVKLHDSGVAVFTLLSYPPYPHNLDVGFSIKAPPAAEKHLYRFNVGQAEVAYSAAWGKDIYETKRRCRKTVDNCANYNQDIQHRVDYGCRAQFVVNQEKWTNFGGKS